MENREFWTRANRKSKVTRTSIGVVPHGDLARPRASDLQQPSESELQQAVLNDAPIWRLSVFYRTGFGEEDRFGEMYASLGEAEEAQLRFPIGGEVDPFGFLRPKSREFDFNELSGETIISIYGRGRPPYFLIYEALQGAGVHGKNNRLSERVIDWVGAVGKEALEAKYGENWTAIAALEYCAKHFHPTSLASLAARVLVADLIADSDYDAGYASKWLEVLFGGVERVALQSVEARRVAGEGGGRASRERRRANLELVMLEIEKLAQVVGLISEDRILAQAFESARELQPNMPKSSKTLEDYGTALRSEEPYKKRYEAVFRKST